MPYTEHVKTMRILCKGLIVPVTCLSFVAILSGCTTSDSSSSSPVYGRSTVGSGSSNTPPPAPYYGPDTSNTANSTDRMRSEFRNNW